MQPLGIIAVVAVIAAALWMLAVNWREKQKELFRMENLRASRLYKDAYPLIQRASTRDVEQVRVERDRVTITLVSPPGVLGTFELRQSGHLQMSRIRTRVMAEVIAEDIMILQDRGKYSLRRYRIIRPNGSEDFGYVYTIRTHYKDAVLAARRRIEGQYRI